MITVCTDNLSNVLPRGVGPNVPEFSTMRGVCLPAFLIRNSNQYTVYHKDVMIELIDGSLDVEDGGSIKLNRFGITLVAIQYSSNSRVFVLLSNMIVAVFVNYIKDVFGLESCNLIYNNLPLDLTKELHEVFDLSSINVVYNIE